MPTARWKTLKESSIWVCHVAIPWYQASSIETNRDIVPPCAKGRIPFSPKLKGGFQTPNNLYVWLLHSYQGYFAICQHLLTIMCGYQTIWKLWIKVVTRKGLPSDSSLIPTISHRDTYCQHVPNEGCHFLPTKEGPPPPQCVRLNLSSLLLGMLLSFVNTHVL